MKNLLLLAFFLPLLSFGQGAFKKGTKGNDYIIVTNDGIHFAIGPTYMIPSKPISGVLTDNLGARGNYEITPKGQMGFFGEVGFAHFPKWKGIPIKPLKKSRIMDYVDWGVGFRQLSGTESTHVDIKNALGEIVQSYHGEGSFKNNYVFARVSAHTLIYYGKKKIDKARKHFIDQSLGLNFDYNLIRGSETYDDNYSNHPLELKFQKPFVAQLHYSLGIGIRLNRAWMLVPGVHIPIVSAYEWNGFNAKANWFASQYWPIQAQIKVIKLFERPPKCGVYGDPKDAEIDKQFRMGN
jgi:hypothetical protein